MMSFMAASDTSSRRQLCESLWADEPSLLPCFTRLLFRCSFTSSALTISGTDDCRFRPPLGVGVTNVVSSASPKTESMSDAAVSDACVMTRDITCGGRRVCHASPVRLCLIRVRGQLSPAIRRPNTAAADR